MTCCLAAAAAAIDQQGFQKVLVSSGMKEPLITFQFTKQEIESYDVGRFLVLFGHKTMESGPWGACFEGNLAINFEGVSVHSAILSDVHLLAFCEYLHTLIPYLGFLLSLDDGFYSILAGACCGDISSVTGSGDSDECVVAINTERLRTFMVKESQAILSFISDIGVNRKVATRRVRAIKDYFRGRTVGTDWMRRLNS